MDKIFTVENIGKLGVIGLLSTVLVTGSLGYWVWGNTYTEMKVDRDRWENLALQGVDLSKRVSAVRMPIMANAPGESNKKPTPAEVQAQLDLIKRLNNKN